MIRVQPIALLQLEITLIKLLDGTITKTVRAWRQTIRDFIISSCWLSKEYSLCIWNRMEKCILIQTDHYIHSVLHRITTDVSLMNNIYIGLENENKYSYKGIIVPISFNLRLTKIIFNNAKNRFYSNNTKVIEAINYFLTYGLIWIAFFLRKSQNEIRKG